MTSAMSVSAYIAVVRPKVKTSLSSSDYKAKWYEIILLEDRLGDPQRTVKGLLHMRIRGGEDPNRQVLEYVYDATKKSSSKMQGLRGKRAVQIARFAEDEIAGRDTRSNKKAFLYVVPVATKDQLSMPTDPSQPSFCCLQDILRVCAEGHGHFPTLTSRMLRTLDHWLKEQHSVPHAVEALFRPSALERIKMNVLNPAYSHGSDHHGDRMATPEEAMARMMEVEKCDIVIINPVFGSDLKYTNQVDAYVVNKFYGLGTPDYSKLKVPDKSADSPPRREKAWMEEYPLHRAISIGDMEKVKDLLAKGTPVQELDKESWGPIHYACWYGQLEAGMILLEQGKCNPNLVNRNKSTPLHIAAGCGHPALVQLLLRHPEIDRNAMNKEGQTPLDVCEQNKQNEWEHAATLLKEALNKPYQKIRVHLMDGSHKELSLISGNNTTVEIMLNQLNFPDSCKQLFAIWIASRNLFLQMKPEHKPLHHLRDWAEIVGELTDCNPEDETPLLYVRRDARLHMEAERKVQDPMAIKMLFDEARTNMLHGMYACSDEDTVAMAGIMMQIIYGDHDTNRHKPGFLNDLNLKLLLPSHKLRNRNMNWVEGILLEHQQLTHQGMKDIQTLQYLYLQRCWNFPTYGCAFFSGQIMSRPVSGSSRHIVSVHVGVNCLGIHILNAQTKQLLYSSRFSNLQWEYSMEGAYFQLRTRDNQSIRVHTKQAALICNLMTKLHSRG
ncbi:krev interaction trapped protein 1-like [Branchiostoma floridae]|uniref:Krev interaction trapped protein 1-like n=1 Tax=Branchiostoma floridae TaxID=7739 RepID=A0A9J7KJ40_BRAFL|nr:krev interaction trapped protein 1-like [Branchiostoma floridae]